MRDNITLSDPRPSQACENGPTILGHPHQSRRPASPYPTTETQTKSDNADP
ncbi:hypothetical protein SERLA73DRAFT_81606 [Serpula lacrymans var. lacrymans S7.3]|uniref:Uncharacterized protein n=1 Tax=Serpula lacrymans var. lacrymans (strain S7.3) TaxID=936435 RepID=F8QL38_SERL3|nr:hypothetical protein SERLA73DRAFT_81606 [Serpula lacrymans var. lacrymans S7.3]